MKVLFVQIGKTNQPFLLEGISMYDKRIKHYIPFEIEILPVIKRPVKMSVEQVKESQGQMLLSSLKKGDYVVLLDEQRTQYGSEEFADFIENKWFPV